MSPPENFRPVPGFAGWYEAGDQGSVRSLARAATAGGFLKPQVINGYRTVVLSKYGQPRLFMVGRVVLMTFAGPANGRRAIHGPGGKQDDRLSNLNWG